jgi:hypothetical protein
MTEIQRLCGTTELNVVTELANDGSREAPSFASRAISDQL